MSDAEFPNNVQMIAAEDLWLGAVVDLEGDAYADPNRENTRFQYEYEKVEDYEITKDRTLIHFEGISVDFPPRHEVKVMGDLSDDPPESPEVMIAFFKQVREETA